MGSERNPEKETFPDHGQRAGNREAVPLVAFPVATNCSRRVCARRTPRGAATSSSLERERDRDRDRHRERERGEYVRLLLWTPGSSFLGRLVRSESTGSTGIFLETCAPSSN